MRKQAIRCGALKHYLPRLCHTVFEYRELEAGLNQRNATQSRFTADGGADVELKARVATPTFSLLLLLGIVVAAGQIGVAHHH